jgi:hypothetical protein
MDDAMESQKRRLAFTRKLAKKANQWIVWLQAKNSS